MKRKLQQAGPRILSKNVCEEVNETQTKRTTKREENAKKQGIIKVNDELNNLCINMRLRACLCREIGKYGIRFGEVYVERWRKFILW